MSAEPPLHDPADWGGTTDPAVQADQRAALDRMRGRCPVARDDRGAWTLLRHDDVLAAAEDAGTFSSAVSRFLQVPNGQDGAEHARFRRLVDSFFVPERMTVLEPALSEVAATLVAALPRGRPVDAVGEVGSTYAVRATCAWLGWPSAIEAELLQWMRVNHAASRSGELARTTEVAEWFDRIIRALTDARRELAEDAPHDVTTELVHASLDGVPLADEEIVSILRNWTAGDLASMALCVGVVLRHLADHPDVQETVRARLADDAALDRAVDEMLRIDDPFVSNRRVTTRDTTVGGRSIAAGEVVVLSWTAANRDPERFGDPDAFRPDENAAHNLVYGAGPHVCPGRPLATLELRVLVRELLSATSWIEPGGEPERELPPLGGHRTAPVVLHG